MKHALMMSALTVACAFWCGCSMVVPPPVDATPTTEQVERAKLLEEQRKDSITLFAETLKGAAGFAVGLWAVFQFRATQRNTFKLKALELALAADSPNTVRNKAIVIQKMFDSVLPDDFVQNLGTKELAGFGQFKET